MSEIHTPTFNNSTIPILFSSDWEKRFKEQLAKKPRCCANVASDMVNDLDGLSEDQKFALERFVTGIVQAAWEKGLQEGVWGKP